MLLSLVLIMVITKEKINQIGITLPLIALSLPLFANHYAKADNSCPYETYIHVEEKCIDISEQGLGNLTQELEDDAVLEVSKEIKQVSQELADLGDELEEFCLELQPETSAEVEIVEDICQY